jgi:hypothetical protein
MTLATVCECRPNESYAKPERRSTTRSHLYVQDAETELRNWARWCRDYSGIYPQCVSNWDLIDSIQYKNCHKTTQERLDEVMAQEPIQEPMAERVDLWVRQFDPLPRQALRVQYVFMPDGMRADWHMDYEQWQARRAAITRATLRKQGISLSLDVDGYEQAVSDGVGQVQGWINKWTVGI